MQNLNEMITNATRKTQTLIRIFFAKRYILLNAVFVQGKVRPAAFKL